jgi:hypothetical protein
MAQISGGIDTWIDDSAARDDVQTTVDYSVLSVSSIVWAVRRAK